ncbi:hypothetical protein Peur_003551 [Populus x canadensis]
MNNHRFPTRLIRMQPEGGTPLPALTLQLTASRAKGSRTLDAGEPSGPHLHVHMNPSQRHMGLYMLISYDTCMSSLLRMTEGESFYGGRAKGPLLSPS